MFLLLLLLLVLLLLLLLLLLLILLLLLSKEEESDQICAGWRDSKARDTHAPYLYRQNDVAPTQTHLSCRTKQNGVYEMFKYFI